MPDDAPAPSALADALDAMATEMNAYPNLPVSAEEIALLHRFASAIRKLTADNARLRSIVNDVCELPYMDAQSWADKNMRMMRDAMEVPGPAEVSNA